MTGRLYGGPGSVYYTFRVNKVGATVWDKRVVVALRSSANPLGGAYRNYWAGAECANSGWLSVCEDSVELRGFLPMANGEPFLIVGLGEVLWDMLPDGRRLGGAPANFVYHAQALGARGVMVSAVGSDPPGDEILAELASSGLETEFIHRDRARPTGTVTVELDSRGNPTFTIHENAAWDCLPFTEQCGALARDADAICFGTLASRDPHSRECIRKFLEEAMPGCLRVLDVNLRQHYYSRALIETLLEHTEVLKLSEDELPVVSGLLNLTGSTKDRMETLLGRYALDAIAVTRGARGSVLMTPGMLEVHQGVRVDSLVDTVGAGDAFTAALVMGLLEERPIEELRVRANELASHVCTHAGAMAPHPVWTDSRQPLAQ